MFLLNACNNKDGITNSDNTLKHYTLSLQPDSLSGKDAAISFYSYSGDRNYGKYPNMGPYCWTINGVLVINRDLIQFDLSSIPSDARIDSAYVSFFYSTVQDYPDSAHVGDNYMLLQRIIENWQENSVTWNTQPKVDTKHTVWIDKFSNPQQNYENIDVTLIMRDIIRSGNNFGFMLRFADEWPYKITLIASSDNPDSTKHPKLVVYYSK